MASEEEEEVGTQQNKIHTTTHTNTHTNIHIYGRKKKMVRNWNNDRQVLPTRCLSFHPVLFGSFTHFSNFFSYLRLFARFSLPPSLFFFSIFSFYVFKNFNFTLWLAEVIFPLPRNNCKYLAGAWKILEFLFKKTLIGKQRCHWYKLVPALQPFTFTLDRIILLFLIKQININWLKLNGNGVIKIVALF